MELKLDPKVIEGHGWRQGSILGPLLSREAAQYAPGRLTLSEKDWLVVTSHDCDLLNDSLAKEPFVEILRAEIVNRSSPDKPFAWGRNPRAMQLEVFQGTERIVLSMRVHERWTLPRERLMTEAPFSILESKQRRLISEWLAKRYIRAAFPSAFDHRWKSELKAWTSILETRSFWIQGVYLRLNTLLELNETMPYMVHLFVAVTASATTRPEWPAMKNELILAVETFWAKFNPGIQFVEVEVLGINELTLADIQDHQRFDVDWVSFADDSISIPDVVDITT